MRTEGIRAAHRGLVPDWARSGKEVRHG
jgi:hypothetical protein